MSLTAARTELNIVLQGQDETQRIIEAAQARMQQLDAQVRRLTASINAQGGAAGGAGAATNTWGDRIRAVTGTLEAGQERVDGFTGKIKNILGTFGDVGDIVSGAIDAFKFLSEQFDDSGKAAERLKKELADQEEQLKNTTAATLELAKAQAESIAGARAAAISLTAERLRLAKLQKDMAAEARLTREMEVQTQKASLAQTQTKIAELQEKEQAARTASSAATTAELQGRAQLRELDKELKEAEDKKRKIQATLQAQARGVAGIGTRATIGEDDLSQAIQKITDKLRERNAVNETMVTANKIQAEQALKTAAALKLERQELERLANVQEQVAVAMETAPPEPAEKPDKPKPPSRGGKAKPKDKDAEDAAKKAAEEAEALRLKAEEDAAFAAKNAETMMRVNAALRYELRESIDLLRQQIETSLAAVPAGAQYAETREKLKAQLKAANEQMEIFNGLIHISDPDVMTSAIDKQTEAVDKLATSFRSVTEAQQKVQEEAEKTRRELERAMPADLFEKFSGPLEQLGQIAAPAFEAVSQAVSGVTAQLAKYKDGQQSLTASLIGAGGAIAGQIAKNVDGVKAEATVRAAFETAMGFATLFSNPAASVGHFTAAAMFAGLATGVVKMPSSGGGQSAKDTKPAASTRDSGMGGGGGGVVTNVYNLQTGIIDGQSTAIAFRRAEQTARNTGMASAGGW